MTKVKSPMVLVKLTMKANRVVESVMIDTRKTKGECINKIIEGTK